MFDRFSERWERGGTLRRPNSYEATPQGLDERSKVVSVELKTNLRRGSQDGHEDD